MGKSLANLFFGSFVGTNISQCCESEVRMIADQCLMANVRVERDTEFNRFMA
jgi:hypothetical protein